MKPRPASRLAHPLAFAVATMLAVQSMHAANIWDGCGNGNWNTANNWDNNVVPTTGALTFTGDIQASTNNDRAAALLYGGINITNGVSWAAHETERFHDAPQPLKYRR